MSGLNQKNVWCELMNFKTLNLIRLVTELDDWWTPIKFTSLVCLKKSFPSCLWFGAIGINLFDDRIVHFCHSCECFTWLSWHSKILGFSECENLTFWGLFIELRHLIYCVSSFCQLFSMASGCCVILFLSKTWNCDWLSSVWFLRFE